MRIVFRHYKIQKGTKGFQLGFVLYDLKPQPTLDILFARHVFVVALIKRKKDI